MSRKVYELIVPLIIKFIVFICFDEQNEWFRNFFIFWIEGFINIIMEKSKSSFSGQNCFLLDTFSKI